MSWIEKLYQTYDNNASNIGININDQIPLWPLWHITQKAHITIIIDGAGNFLRAQTIPKHDARTIIPATEESAGRTANPAPHPLCDKLQYIAEDYKSYGGKKEPYFEFYHKQLLDWCNSPFQNIKINSVLKYIEKKQIIKDLINAGVLIVDSQGKLLTKWNGKKKDTPEIFKINKEQLESFVRWSVEIPGEAQADLYTNKIIWQSWIDYYSGLKNKQGICFVTGKETQIAEQHPKKIRNDSDGAKLISSNDTSGYTFLGRYTERTGEQVCGVGSEITQKAHSALRWLIGRQQAFKNDDQVIVSWAVSGKKIPALFNDTFNLFAEEGYTIDSIINDASLNDAGQSFSQRFNKYIAGYSVKLGPTNDIVILGLDSASPGRLSLIFYRELTGSDFLERLSKWHSNLAWKQKIMIKKDKKNKIIKAISAPAPKDIAGAVYGPQINEKLKKLTIERLLSCIIDGNQIPWDLVKGATQRACNRMGLKYWDWEQTLDIACSLYKGYYLYNIKNKRSYSMSLETDRTTRDYLYGRLLAVADDIESLAIYIGGENRDTSACKLMQRFSNRPFSTWKNIESALIPYISRLQSKRPGYLYKKKELLDKIHGLFHIGDYENDSQLSGEFLLGYHCQREAFKTIEDKTIEDKSI